MYSHINNTKKARGGLLGAPEAKISAKRGKPEKPTTFKNRNI
jgi:hypothetical protein